MSATATSGTTVEGPILEVGHAYITLALLGTDYKIHLVPTKGGTHAVGLTAGTRVHGTIHAKARRVDVIRAGGRFIEPVIGRPRRLAGRISATDPQHNTITVQCGAPFICVLTANQNAADFQVGSLVTFDVERGASIELG